MATALLGRGPQRLVAFCRVAFPLLTGVLACFCVYVLSLAGVTFNLANRDKEVEVMFYKRTLERFALLEATQGRFEKLLDLAHESKSAKVVKVADPSGFNDAEVRDRTSLLVKEIPKAPDLAMKRQLLATLALFKDRIAKDTYLDRKIVQSAMDAGAPPAASHIESLDWIAANLHHDGWDPLPLYKVTE